MKPGDELTEAGSSERKLSTAGVRILAFSAVLVIGAGILWFTNMDAGGTAAGEPSTTVAGSTPVAPATEPPVGHPIRVVSEECGAVVLEPGPPAESIGETRLVLETIGTLAGDTVGFSWEVDAGLNPITGDEALVDCWTGDQWKPAWAVIDLYSNRGGPQAVALVDDLLFTADGFGNTTGAMVIPADAPDGWYRFRHSIALCRNGCRPVEGVALFVVGFELIDSAEDG